MLVWRKHVSLRVLDLHEGRQYKNNSTYKVYETSTLGSRLRERTNKKKKKNCVITLEVIEVYKIDTNDDLHVHHHDNGLY